MPDSQTDCWAWPSSGEFRLADLAPTHPQKQRPTVLALRAAPLRLHLQVKAHWVVVEIDGPCAEGEHGALLFERGRVLCNQRWPDVCRFLQARGLPCPKHDSHPLVVGADCEDVSISGMGTAIGGRAGSATTGAGGRSLIFMGRATTGNGGLAYSSIGKAEAGANGQAICVSRGNAKAGDDGLAFSREGGRAEVGLRGVAWSADFCACAAAGAGGVAITSGFRGNVRAGIGGTLVAMYTTSSGQPMTITARVGESGIKPDTPYRCEGGRFVEGEYPMPAPRAESGPDSTEEST
jgi:hypothetical protein